jgi:quercetin 2,3-dioxygenase
MKTVLFPANERGHADHGWLNSYHSFSFASYYDPNKIHYGMLRVLNDDTVAPGMGFGTHPHDNMEIVSIPLEGILEHKDSMGHTQTLRPGEVQLMSAGTGLQHSEYNHSKTEAVKFLQVWVFPKERNIKPRYNQKMFDVKNHWTTVVSPGGEDGSLDINQDAWFCLAKPNETETLSYELHAEDHGVYLFVIEGSAEIGDHKLGRRDAIGISETRSLKINAEKGSHLLLIEIPMK